MLCPYTSYMTFFSSNPLYYILDLYSMSFVVMKRNIFAEELIFRSNNIEWIIYSYQLVKWLLKYLGFSMVSTTLEQEIGNKDWQLHLRTYIFVMYD